MTDSAHDLAEPMAALERRVRELIDERLSSDPKPSDPFRGLHISDTHVDWLLRARRPSTSSEFRDGVTDVSLLPTTDDTGRALDSVRTAFHLSDLDVAILLIAIAPEIDSRFEQFYGYLNDDVSARRATCALAFDLLDISLADAAARRRLRQDLPLLVNRLITIRDASIPFGRRELRVPDRVIGHLLGDDDAAHELDQVLIRTSGNIRTDASVLATALMEQSAPIYLREEIGSASRMLSDSAAAEAGLSTLHVDLKNVDPGPDLSELIVVAGREAKFRRAVLVVGPVDLFAAANRNGISTLVDLDCAVVMIGRRIWDPEWSHRLVLTLRSPPMTAEDRRKIWDCFSSNGLIRSKSVEAFQLTPEAISRSIEFAQLNSYAHGRDPTANDLVEGARAQNVAGLEQLARRVEPRVTLDDMVVTADVGRQLRSFASRVMNRIKVLNRWKMRPGGLRGQGVAALFAGDPGTGKTMAAEAIAASLGFDMYSINLASVVDKYIGETEKNLERIFDEADGVNGVIVFDEADALFGKRSEVSDAQDRHANIEVAYLLQRIESFNGVIVLSTNLRANIDEAFARRFDLIVDFPNPDVKHRVRLWKSCLRPPLPLGSDVDFEFCADAFELTGGSIRAAAITAAYLAADENRAVEMKHLVSGITAEYRKLGRLVTESEFGVYYSAGVETEPFEWVSDPDSIRYTQDTDRVGRLK